MDSSTISLFKDILKGVGRNPKNGKKKGGINAHTLIKADENVPCLIRYSEAARHDHMFLQEAQSLPSGSIITFDKGYVDYTQYEASTQKSIWYLTRLKDNALYKARKDFDIPDDADYPCKKQAQPHLGIFKYGFCNKTTADELHQYIRLLGKPGEKLALTDKRR